MNTSELLAMLNRKIVRAETTSARLRVLLMNALVLLEEQGFGGKSFAVEELGMTEKEYIEIMGE